MSNENHKTKLGWVFTDREERWMKRGIRLANDFMKTYGQGRQPIMLDESKYICNGKGKSKTE